MSLQYLKKELSYEVDVLHVDKLESLVNLKVDSIMFDGFGHLQYLCDILGKK